MSESTDKRNWLLLIAIAALVVLLWDNGPNLFHFHWNIPFWPIVIVAFAIWWMSGGKEESDCCGGEGPCCQDPSTEHDHYAGEGHEDTAPTDEEDEESAKKG
jgi:hypothetical protein